MADPVSIIVGPIVNNIIDTAASLIKGEFLAILNVEKEVKNLSSNLTAISAVLKDAEQRQLDAACGESLRDWLRKLKDVACDAEDILDTFATETFLWKRKKQVRKILAPTNLINKSSVAHKIKEISARLDVIAKQKNDFHLTESSDGGKTPNLPHTPFFVDITADVFGRESDRDELINRMLSNESDTEGDVSVIPIVGMGGLGKTTLAQLIFKDERVKNHFEFKMWVHVTVDFNFGRILKEMIEFHTEMKYSSDVPTRTLESRFLEFLAGKSFLLVLDDVWTDDYQEWEPLQNLLKQGGKGSRVLVTTRNTRVSDIMGTQPPYRLECLPEDECWSLFKKIAFKDCNSLVDTHRKELEVFGRQIVEKCNGLPLAVKAMGGVLRGNIDVNKWKQILRDSVWELEKDQNRTRPKILPALKLSYDHLPSYLKQCYAYCSIFPKAYVFDRKELVKLWMAEAFIQSSGQNSVEETGIEYFNELLMRSFFQILNIDDKVRYRMHDLIHDLAVSVSSPHCCQVKDNNSGIFSEETRHVSLLGQDVENPTLQIVERSTKLRTLLLPGESLKNLGQALDKMFHSLKYIRVLNLSSSSFSELPSSIENLKLLRYLDLSRTEIKVLPNSICNLCNLQTLKLLGCFWLFELPKDLGNLVNLRHLELDEMFWFKCEMLPPRMGNLTSLQNLHAFPVSGTSGHGIEELKNMAKLTKTLHILKLENAVNAAEAKLKEKESLQKLVLEWSGQDVNQEDEIRAERDLEDLQPHSNLKELALHHFKGSNFPLWMTDGLLQNLVRLTLSHCTKCTTLSVGQLPCLRALYIKGMLELEEWPGVQCLSLDRLHIKNCPKLRKVPDLMPNLTVLKIKKCDSLKALPMAPLMFLVLIDNLVLEDWKEGMFIAQDDQGNQVGQPKPTLISLLELKMANCPNIQALPKIFAPQKLEISGCGLITALPVPQFAQRLQHLALDSCSNGTLVRAIPGTNTLYSLVISNISNLTSFPKLPHLPGLKTLYISDCKDLTSLSEDEESLKSLSSLKLLSIQGCSKLESLPDEGLPTGLECLMIVSCPILKSLGTKDTLKSLLSLKDLYLDDCPLIQSFPEDGLPTSLLHLVIHECPLLIEQCQKEDAGSTEWPKIMHVTDQEIDSIRLPSAPDLPKKNKWTPLFGFSKGP
ncbi:PREDICTED: putative disease resistance protein RGA3 [Theobroma cacao]|uniref:Disease resistance protein RGA3 n=1 Tax=Theobroma cacao TaxID=3641 RepID=A0AB32V5J2_THECC|nr:PREDICTED: putative disease resistance protein RGA3 [Theobroma cacao]